MLTRRRALAILGATGIGNGVFQWALAAKAADAPVSPEMVADAEWVAGIKRIPGQREAAANHLNEYRESTKRIRAIELDNSPRPGIVLTLLTSPASRPDPRGYQVVASPMPVPRSPSVCDLNTLEASFLEESDKSLYRWNGMHSLRAQGLDFICLESVCRTSRGAYLRSSNATRVLIDGHSACHSMNCVRGFDGAR
jgi:hypothetical protein